MKPMPSCPGAKLFHWTEGIAFFLTLTQPEDDLTNPRTKAMLQRLQRAKQEIEADIATHHGLYPCNHGGVTQSELCRRAGLG